MADPPGGGVGDASAWAPSAAQWDDGAVLKAFHKAVKSHRTRGGGGGGGAAAAAASDGAGGRGRDAAYDSYLAQLTQRATALAAEAAATAGGGGRDATPAVAAAAASVDDAAAAELACAQAELDAAFTGMRDGMRGQAASSDPDAAADDGGDPFAAEFDAYVEATGGLARNEHDDGEDDDDDDEDGDGGGKGRDARPLFRGELDDDDGDAGVAGGGGDARGCEPVGAGTAGATAGADHHDSSAADEWQFAMTQAVGGGGSHDGDSSEGKEEEAVGRDGPARSEHNASRSISGGAAPALAPAPAPSVAAAPALEAPRGRTKQTHRKNTGGKSPPLAEVPPRAPRPLSRAQCCRQPQSRGRGARRWCAAMAACTALPPHTRRCTEPRRDRPRRPIGPRDTRIALRQHT
jgi:hypothetical protein